MQKAKWVFDNLEVIFGVLTTVLLVVLMFIQVISRYVFNYALPWTEELAIICFIVSVYFGCALAVTRDQHLTIDLFLHYMPFKVKKVLALASNICFIGFCLYIIGPMSELLEKLYTGKTKMIVTGVPHYIVYSIVVFCLMLTVVRLIQKSISIYRLKDEMKKAKPILDIENL
ncbi:MAG: TRAP transporter small permease [Sporomusaceae bacterium]|nr:TRAP transporter small permease [Sporomusaceae bacterium]